MSHEVHPPPTQNSFDESGQPVKAWTQFMLLISRLLSGLTESGTTAQRPTKDLYVARMYYDLTLNKPIWVNSINPTVWKDAAGTTV